MTNCNAKFPKIGDDGSKIIEKDLLLVENEFFYDADYGVIPDFSSQKSIILSLFELVENGTDTVRF